MQETLLKIELAVIMKDFVGKIMKILLTGAAGFIGSHVAEALLKKGHIVVGVDNLNNYYSPKIKKKNLESIGREGFKFHHADIRNKRFMNSLFKKEKFNGVIHLAARAGVRASIEHPFLYETVDITGTMNILEGCKNNKVKKLVFASSSSVYGGNKKVPFSEKDDVSKPISPYAACKKADELLAYTYHHLYGLNVTGLRFFTVYGPRGRPDMAVYKFTKLINSGKVIDVYGDGNTKRDYTYIEDIVKGVLSSLTKCKGYNIYNLGDKNPIKLKKLISLIEKNLGKKAKIKRMGMQPGDVAVTFADISKSKRELGYKPTIKIEEGIKRFVQWFKEGR